MWISSGVALLTAAEQPAQCLHVAAQLPSVLPVYCPELPLSAWGGWC